MEYLEDSGKTWRSYIQEELRALNIKFFDPSQDNFIESLDEIDSKEKRLALMKDHNFDKIQKEMKFVRSYDLNLVDRSDFLVGHIIPKLASWGTAEELYTANRMKKPIFLSVDGGKEKTPLWLMGTLPHKYIYNDIDSIVKKIKSINSGETTIDSKRWRLLKNELR